MEKQEKQEAQKALAELMQAGYRWQDAAKQVGIPVTLLGCLLDANEPMGIGLWNGF
jgi:hypothetical protein